MLNKRNNKGDEIINMAINPILLKALELLIPFVLGMAFIGWFFRIGNFFFTFFKVKRSRGKYVMVKIRDLIRPYYKSGKIEDGEFLVFTDNKKETKRILIPTKSCVYTELGIQWVEVDPVKNALIDYSEMFKAVSGHDANKVDSLLTRALYKPSIVDQKLKIILIIVIVVLLASILNAVVTFQLGKKIDTMMSDVNIIKILLQNSTKTNIIVP